MIITKQKTAISYSIFERSRECLQTFATDTNLILSILYKQRRIPHNIVKKSSYATSLIYNASLD